MWLSGATSHENLNFTCLCVKYHFWVQWPGRSEGTKRSEKSNSCLPYSCLTGSISRQLFPYKRVCWLSRIQCNPLQQHTPKTADPAASNEECNYLLMSSYAVVVYVFVCVGLWQPWMHVWLCKHMCICFFHYSCVCVCDCSDAHTCKCVCVEPKV